MWRVMSHGLILVLSLLGFFLMAGCDDDATGPDKEITPTPVLATPTPAETPDATPTAVPSYDGGWYGIIKTAYPPGCPDLKIWFSIENNIAKGHVDCWVEYPYWMYERPQIESIDFEVPIENESFRNFAQS